MAKRSRVRKNVIYYPPTADDIHSYTRTVCKELADTIDAEFDTPEVHHELAGFIKVIATIRSKQLNKSAEKLDTEDRAE